MQIYSKGHTYTNPWSGQYLTHAHSHIMRAVAASDSCFTLIWAHQQGKAIRLMNRENPHLKNTLHCQGECKAVCQGPAPHNTCGSCWLGTAVQQFYHDMGRESGSWVNSKLKQGAPHIQQPMVWPSPHTCTQPYHSGTGNHGELLRHYWGLSWWHNHRSVNGKNPSLKDPLLLWQVPAPHDTCGSCWLGTVRQFSTTCTGKADHGFDVCVPLGLSLSVENSELNCSTA